MTEAEAKEWVRARCDAPGFASILSIVAHVERESRAQNLISPSTIPTIWTRHVVDSMQLLDLIPAGQSDGVWLDIGTGAGFPGLIVGALRRGQTLLVEPRAKRARFLERVVDDLALATISVVPAKVERVAHAPVEIISARAVAGLSELLACSGHIASPSTIFLFPKGVSAAEEVERALVEWHGVFHVKHSITDPAAGIVVAQGIRRKR